jgi:BirA family biotin operon repressor/biotin-[acetyl-CoA-carboxylase] ligase
MNSVLFPRDSSREATLAQALGECAPEQLWKVQIYERFSSTMDAARNLATELAPQQSGIVLADEQLSGRGRQGRSWFSAKGGFAGTFVFRSEQSLASMVGYSLVVGCVVRSVFQSLGASVGLKWPNDVLSLDRRKVCGVLIELSTQAGITSVYTGIGINLLDSPAEVPESTSLYALSGLKFTPDEFLKRLAPELLSAWNTFRMQGFSAFREEWLLGALFSGEQLSFDVGARIVSGRMVGVSDQGALLLEKDGEISEVSSGHQVEPSLR